MILIRNKCLKANGYFTANGNNYYNMRDGSNLYWTNNGPVNVGAPNTLSTTTTYNSINIYTGESPISGSTTNAMAVTSTGIAKYLKTNLFSFVCQYGNFSI